MKTKEQVIKEAWWVHYGADIDENGWRLSNIGSDGWSDTYFDSVIHGESWWMIRPKSLQGIENNNGWIKIDNENDVPKEQCLIYEQESIFIGFFYNDHGYRDHKEATHYQLISNKPPLY